MAAIRAPVMQDGKPLDTTALVGVAIFPADGDSASELLSHAMIATELAKTEGDKYFLPF